MGWMPDGLCAAWSMAVTEGMDVYELYSGHCGTERMHRDGV